MGVAASTASVVAPPTRLAQIDLGQPTPPQGAGLSHVEEHIDQEAVVPGGAFELAPQGGLCIGMSASNIEGKSPQDGEVGGSVIFSAPRLILVENDIERPVQNIFDTRMFATMRSSCAGV